MDKIKSIVTGDAYDKPAMTKDGAMTTQDSPDAHTTEGTSAEGKYSKGMWSRISLGHDGFTDLEHRTSSWREAGWSASECAGQQCHQQGG
jgi:hypothetical protein